MGGTRHLTSREAYHRIRWDPRLDAAAFVIGYTDRLAPGGTALVPLPAWEAGGEIPWHRVVFIRCGGEVVWSRRPALDRLSSGDLPDAAWARSPDPVAFPPADMPPLLARLVHHHSPGGWEPLPSPIPEVHLPRLVVATWNLLADTFLTAPAVPGVRPRALLDCLAGQHADILAVQELTPALFDRLAGQPWLRSWCLSAPPADPGLRPHGLALLSRHPFSLVSHSFTSHKQVLVGTWLVNGRPLHVATVHLTSNRADDGPSQRARQIAWLAEHLPHQPGDCLIAGDFNADDEELGPLKAAGFTDLWEQLHAGAAGFTFDPRSNPLAAATSLTGRPARFDRILFRATPGGWRPGEIRLFADREPFPSDHFGLRAELHSPEEVADLRPVYHSALAVILPEEIWPPIQALRRRFDRQVRRWMPHINLLYGFVPEAHFEAAAQHAETALAALPPFEVTLAGYDTFRHRGSCTAWLRPEADPPGALHALQAALQQAFPRCDEQGRTTTAIQAAVPPAGFTPHLSVGQFRDREEALARLPPWQPVRFRIDAVALISRQADTPFAVRHQVALGKKV